MGDDVRLRAATEEDVDFISWVILTASRSHLPRGIWEYMYDFTEDEALAYIKKASTTDVVHFMHWSLFTIAEVDGTPASAMSGFDPDTNGMGAYMSVVPQLSEGITFDEGFTRRATLFSNAVPGYESGRWIVENVATRPEFRRRGLVEMLLEHEFDRGRSAGFPVTQILVFLGNEAARKAYLKAGYEYETEKRDAELEADFGTAGVERLVRAL